MSRKPGNGMATVGRIARAREIRGRFPRGRRKGARGFSLVEILIVAAIVATLASISLPIYASALNQARIAHAIAEIKNIDKEIFLFETRNGRLPLTLDELGRDDLVDPWGHPYEYLNFSTAKGKGGMRKDRFLVPLNSTYDLYSKGADGQSKPPLAPKVSWDDIIRANDGGYVGLASQF